MKDHNFKRAKEANRVLPRAAGILLFMAWALFFVGTALGAPGGTKGPPNGGEETAGNRLSFPAVTFTTGVDANWAVPSNPTLGVHYSYGCDQPETEGQYSYPNTSCVNNLTAPLVYYTAEECVQLGHPCEGFAAEDLSRIYWQKVDVNNWSADQRQGDNLTGESVDYLDWGDALEAVSWNERSAIRVETQPYHSLIPGFDPTAATCADAATGLTLDPAASCMVGFQMWHVSGQGITEHWGVRASEEAVSYNYDSPYQIINTGTAHLNLSKMAAESAECPAPGGGEEETASLMVNTAPGSFEWDPVNNVWLGALGSETVNPCTWQDAPYSVELSVGGKYVYGYNWRMKEVDLSSCGENWLKTGWWRLTFYTTDDAVVFDDGTAPVTAPPAVPAEVRDDLTATRTFNTATSTEPPPAESDALYTPVVDTANNLTYLDICVVAKSQGGGGGGGAGNKPQAAGGGPGGGNNTPGSGGGGGQGGRR